MPKIYDNVSLRERNTFRVPSQARWFAVLDEVSQLSGITEDERWRESPRLVLGSGSNLLLRGDFEGFVLCVGLRGRKILTEQDGSAEVWAAAGENWHRFVTWCLDRGWGGLENLSLIPGMVGAAPMQNIGAYGVELSERLTAVEVVDLETGEESQVAPEDCQLGYRSSRFKTEDAGRFLISGIRVRLDREPNLRLDYPGLRAELRRSNGPINAKAVSAAVCRLRSKKLPDPIRIGNAGSFFKNPLVDGPQAAQLATRYPELPQYPSGRGKVKLSAAWMIEHCGYKGVRRGAAGVSDKHALVLVNHGDAKGGDIWRLAMDIQETIEQEFGVVLDPEPQIL